MSYCPNCKARLTCGCQKRVAKNGKQGCTNCIASLDAAVLPKTQPVSPNKNSPTGLSTTYKGPGKQI